MVKLSFGHFSTVSPSHKNVIFKQTTYEVMFQVHIWKCLHWDDHDIRNHNVILWFFLAILYDLVPVDEYKNVYKIFYLNLNP